MRKYLLFLLILWCFPLYSQVSGMKNINTIDGLPSDEVYKSFIDRTGYMWFATNSGVCYYDGSSFTTLDMGDGLIDNTILEIEEDSKGRIWFSGISGDLCYFDNGSIKPFKYNSIIQKLKRQAELISSGGLQVIDTNEVIVVTNHAKRIHIKNNQFEFRDGRNGDTILLTKERDKNQLFLTYDPESDRTVLLATIQDSINLTYCGEKLNYDISQVNYRVYLEYSDKIIYLINGKAIIFNANGSIETVQLDFSPVYMIKGIYGGIWVGTRDKGLMFYRETDLFQKPMVTLLEDHIITSMMYDQSTRGWVTTFASGIFHVQSINITNFSHPFDDAINRASNLVKLDNGDIIAFSKKNKI